MPSTSMLDDIILTSVFCFLFSNYLAWVFNWFCCDDSLVDNIVHLSQKTNAQFTCQRPIVPVTADNAQKLSQKRRSSCSVITVNNYPTVVASGWKQRSHQCIGALVSLILIC